jgi:pullulanase
MRLGEGDQTLVIGIAVGIGRIIEGIPLEGLDGVGALIAVVIVAAAAVGLGAKDLNSYKSPDSINSIKWDTLNDATYADSYAYYKGLIAFRKAHPILRLTTPEEVTASISSLPDLASNVNAFLLKGGDIDDDLVVIFNPRKETTTVNLPEGKWNVYVEGNTAGTNVLRSVEGSVTVDAISAMVLVQEKEVPATVNLWLIIGLAAAAVVVVGAVVTVILVKRKK